MHYFLIISSLTLRTVFTYSAKMKRMTDNFEVMDQIGIKIYSFHHIFIQIIDPAALNTRNMIVFLRIAVKSHLATGNFDLGNVTSLKKQLKI